VREGGRLPAPPAEGARQQLRLDQHLEPVADADHRPARLDEAAQRVRQVVRDLVGEDAPGGDVVAIAEAAGDGEQLVGVKQAGVLQQAVDVHQLRGRPGPLEGVNGLAVAVGAGRAEDEGLRLRRHAPSLAPPARG
jgi:hypothetical protein